MGKRRKRKQPAVKPASAPVGPANPVEEEAPPEATTRHATPDHDHARGDDQRSVPEQTAAPPRVSDPSGTAPLPLPGGIGAFYRHLHPRRVRRRSASFSATLGLGLAALICLGVATLSGWRHPGAGIDTRRYHYLVRATSLAAGAGPLGHYGG